MNQSISKEMVTGFKDLPRFDSMVDDIVYNAISIGRPHSFEQMDVEEQKLLVITFFLQRTSYMEKQEIFVETNGSEEFGHFLIAAATGIITPAQAIDHIFQSAIGYYSERIDDIISERYVDALEDDDIKFDLRGGNTYTMYEEIRGV